MTLAVAIAHHPLQDGNSETNGDIESPSGGQGVDIDKASCQFGWQHAH
eukprot:CAMPEP_0203912590 /NCGR_PEP_ID=MMETSP0359-20131031/53649_1 /ASSEMBLY_ACC=CAM_ASM_000338 /TAXON_ID=268821 /ORGANISM="Scrippsiella Hangoei, Strain SHTV-5" /LENGTH=47 /DNA_ID= /DNA_START= /DNA_END= /DNA_ORIENTATION=